jgi:signal transduction histidine kinase
MTRTASWLGARRGRDALVVSGLAAVCIATACGDPRPDTPLRHLYLMPVILAGASGVAPGAVTAAAAVLLHALLVIPQVERSGLDHGTVEGLVSFAMFVAAGVSTGALTTRARRERGRYDTLVGIQRALADDVELTEAVARVRATVATGLVSTVVALVLTDGEDEGCAGDAGVTAADVAEVATTGQPRFLPDLGGGSRVRRAMLAPIRGMDGVLGVLVVTREGEIGCAERATIAAFGAYIGLALENTRLAAARRRFAAELTDKIAAATRELTAIDRAKSAFVAIASHELRTPLTALRGFSELLAVRTFSTAEVQRFAQLMSGEAERLSRIVEDLLDLSRLEQGLTPQLRRTRVALAPAVVAATRIFDRPDIAHRLEIDCPEGLPAGDADADALDRILKNLIANAIKYSPPGPVRVSARARDAMIEFTVEDRGPGIAAEALPRLFEPYFRVPGGANAPRGTGLGLGVVRALVEAHGGTVRVESAREIGTRIRFTIPCVS